MLPFRRRWPAILFVLIAAPICAEFLQMYLPNSGEIVFVLIAVAFFAPLYGGAALVIREIALRRGMGWTGILLLAAAFGILMAGIIDLALFAEHRADVEYWSEMRESTLLAPLSISAYPTVSWVMGHVFMSIGAPLALVAALAPRHQDRPLISKWGITVIGVLFLLSATVIRLDAVDMYGYQPTITQTIVVAAVVLALVGMALSHLGRPLIATGEKPSRGWLLVLSGAVGMLLFDATPWTWGGLVFMVVLLVAMAGSTRRLAATRSWSIYDIAAIAAGALVGRTLIGFLAPPIEGMSTAVKFLQSSVLLAGVLVVVWIVLRQRQRAHSPHQIEENVNA